MLRTTRNSLQRHSQRRSLWHTATLISTSPSSLLAHLLSTPPSATPSVLLYAISKNVPATLISDIQSSLNSNGRETIGCLSEVLSPSLVSHLAPSLSLPPASEAYSLSFATYHSPNPSSKAVTFWSKLSGRPNISVGREIGSRPAYETDLGGAGDESGFEGFLRGDQGWGFGDGNQGKRGVIAELEGVREESVTQVVVFTADRSQPVMSALANYPSAATTGLVGSSTPFHSPTNKPYSLFYNSQTVASGAVGVAIIDSSITSPAKIDYAGMAQLGKAMKVTSAKGNIVLTLSEQNAARLLLKAVQELPSRYLPDQGTAVQRGEEKEQEFFAAVFETEPTDVVDLSKARHISQIMAGDPSRGAMSVATEEEMKVGYYVAFLHRPLSTPPLSALIEPSPASLTFISTRSSESEPRSVAQTPAEGEVVSVAGWVVASENGVVLSRPSALGGGVWSCGTEGVVSRLD